MRPHWSRRLFVTPSGCFLRPSRFSFFSFNIFYFVSALFSKHRVSRRVYLSMAALISTLIVLLSPLPDEAVVQNLPGQPLDFSVAAAEREREIVAQPPVPLCCNLPPPYYTVSAHLWPIAPTGNGAFMSHNTGCVPQRPSDGLVFRREIDK